MCVALGMFGGQRSGGSGAASGAGPATHAALPGVFVCRAVKSLADDCAYWHLLKWAAVIFGGVAKRAFSTGL